jgi:tRNA-dihydrouridine synthase B
MTEISEIRPLSIGPLLVDPPLLQSPMAGFTNSVFRQIVRQFGGLGLPVTEMVSARGFCEMETRGGQEPDRLWGVRDEPRPLAVQIWDNDPGTLAEVARRLVDDYRVSVIDLNFGCPARDISQKAQSGSWLLRDPEKIGQIVSRVVEVCGQTPVTAKIRLGINENQITASEVACAVEESGGAALTVHGRTARQMYRGSADWTAIARVGESLKRIPLIGNGDIKTAEDVVRAFADYSVDGVMIGRAALRRPWIFAQAAALLNGQPMMDDLDANEEGRLLLDQLRLAIERFGPQKGVVLMRTYACCYAVGRPGVRKFRATISQVKSVDQMTKVIGNYFSHVAAAE